MRSGGGIGFHFAIAGSPRTQGHPIRRIARSLAAAMFPRASPPIRGVLSPLHPSLPPGSRNQDKPTTRTGPHCPARCLAGTSERTPETQTARRRVPQLFPHRPALSIFRKHAWPLPTRPRLWRCSVLSRSLADPLTPNRYGIWQRPGHRVTTWVHGPHVSWPHLVAHVCAWQVPQFVWHVPQLVAHV